MTVPADSEAGGFCTQCGVAIDTASGNTVLDGEAGGFCTQCGGSAGAGNAACRRAAVLDPPRYCPRCGRRMVVKVTPDRWTAHCSRHGVFGQGVGAAG
jgi:hypothetical protein